ncbi:MAG TPA: hypothetical protein PLD99_02775 [Parcubacteria group bacterium]|nr:hypothetical protein [Parcubacteria group bacterium]
MTRPIQPTPTVRGKDAIEILREIRAGTPLTPERAELFRRADEIFRNSGHAFRINREPK